MEFIPLERDAPSRHVPPDIYLGIAHRQAFLDKVREITFSRYLQTATFDPRHVIYNHLTAVSRERISPRKVKTSAAPSPVTSASTSPDFDRHPDVITARSALSKIVSISVKHLEGDLIQEACAKLVGHEEAAKNLRWKIAHDAMIDFLRKENRTELDRERPEDTEDHYTGEVSKSSELDPRSASPGTIGRDAALHEAMKALPPRQYQAVALHFYAGHDCEEIGVAMNTTERAAQALLSRAYASMRDFFDGDRVF